MITAAMFLALQIAAQNPPQSTAGLTVRDVEPADAIALAPKVLPADVAAKVAGGWVRRVWSPQVAYTALFWEAAEPDGERFCARRVHVVELSNPNLSGRAPPETPLAVAPSDEGLQYGLAHPETATVARCAQVQGFIGMETREEGEPRLRMLTRLADAMALAAGDGPLPFEMECTGEDAVACRDPRRALANLPLEALLEVRLLNNQYRVDPNQPGVRYMLPVVGDRWPLAEVSFDSSGSDGKSWTVTLEGVDRLETVRMRRTTIIRH